MANENVREDWLVLIGQTQLLPDMLQFQADSDSIAAYLQKNPLPSEALTPNIQALPSELNDHKAQVLDEPALRYSYPPESNLDIGVIDLDRVCVYQMSICTSYVEKLKKTFDATINEALFWYCFPKEAIGSATPFVNVDRNEIKLVSESDEFRLLRTCFPTEFKIESNDAEVTKPFFGRPSLFPMFVFGFGINYLSVWEVENRLILMNGSHRAFSLYSQGIRWVPCLINKLPNVAGIPTHLQKQVAIAFRPRPPMFRDYFDTKLYRTTQSPVNKKGFLITVQEVRIDDQGNVLQGSTPSAAPATRTPKDRAEVRKKLKKKWGL